MKTFTRIFCFFAVVLLVSADSENGIDKQLETKLKSDDVAVRLETVKLLVLKMPDKGIRELLINHYKTLPKKRHVEWNGPEMEREMIVEAVGKHKSKESEQFLADVINEEYGAALHEEEEGDIYNLPCVVRDTAVQIIGRYYTDSKILKQTIDKWLGTGLDFDFKQELTAVKIMFEMKQAEITNIALQVKYIADKIKPKPIRPIPENIYIDKEKRIEYGKSDKYNKEGELIGNYLRSKEGITEIGLELALEYLGRNAVEHIVDYVRNNKMERAKSDQLMVIASKIMSNHVNIAKEFSDEDKKVLDEIQKYSEGMENQGVFDREDDVKNNLERIKKILE